MIKSEASCHIGGHEENVVEMYREGRWIKNFSRREKNEG
jgi:hypothetical protein